MRVSPRPHHRRRELDAAIFVVLAGVVGAAAAVAVARARATGLARQVAHELAAQRDAALRTSVDALVSLAREELGAHTAAGTAALDTRNELMDQRIDALHRQLDQVGGLVRELEHDREQRYGELSEQLAHTSRGTAELARTARALEAALTSQQARGQWGERMAEDVLRAAGFVEGVNYLRQASSRAGRPDFTFLLPGERCVHMDVKFPLANYLRARAADHADEEQRYVRAFTRDVRARVKEVSARDYVDAAAGTLGQVLLFIPNEQVYAFVHQHDPDLLDAALAQRVVLCSPLTLFAVLAVIREAVDQFALDHRRDALRRGLAAVEGEGRAVVAGLATLQGRVDAVRRETDALTGVAGRLERELALLTNRHALPDPSVATGEPPEHGAPGNVSGSEGRLPGR